MHMNNQATVRDISSLHPTVEKTNQAFIQSLLHPHVWFPLRPWLFLYNLVDCCSDIFALSYQRYFLIHIRSVGNKTTIIDWNRPFSLFMPSFKPKSSLISSDEARLGTFGHAVTWMTSHEQYGGLLCFFPLSEEGLTFDFNCIAFCSNSVYPNWLKCFLDSNTSPTPPSA